MTLVLVTAYHSFSGEVEASNTPTIRRLTPSCRHQLPRIAQPFNGLSAAVIQVPKRDGDGNALGGVRLPDIAVPTGTSGGQNQPQTFTCMLVGSFSAFAATKAERE